MENPKESDLALLFGHLSHNEKPFEIKPTLVKTLFEPHAHSESSKYVYGKKPPHLI